MPTELELSPGRHVRRRDGESRIWILAYPLGTGDLWLLYARDRRGRQITLRRSATKLRASWEPAP